MCIFHKYVVVPVNADEPEYRVNVPVVETSYTPVVPLNAAAFALPGVIEAYGVLGKTDANVTVPMIALLPVGPEPVANVIWKLLSDPAIDIVGDDPAPTPASMLGVAVSLEQMF